MWIYKILPRRLDRQVVFIFALVMIVLFPLYAMNEADKEIREVTKNISKETKVVASNIAESATRYVVLRDFTAVENLLLRAAEFPGVSALQVVDKNGRVMSDVRQAKAGPVSHYDLEIIRPPAEPGIQLLYDDTLLQVWEPIQSGSQIGWVRLSYDIDSAYQHAYQRLKDYLLHVGAFVFFIAVLILLFLRKPMHLLGEAAEFASHIKEKTGDSIPVVKQSIELEKLTTALNETSSQLYHQEEMIRRIVKDLETQKTALDQHSIVSILDREGMITYANNKFLEVTGYDEDEVFGKPLDVIKGSRSGDGSNGGVWNVVRNGYIWQGEINSLNKSGQEICLYTSIIPVLNDGQTPYQYVEIATDITKKKQVEAELEQKNKILKELTEHLEETVQQRTADLEAANRELVYLNKIKSEFVSVVSHELRTPLTSIKLFAELLQDDIHEMDASVRQRYLGIINDEADRLGRLINDVLDLQKMDSGMMQWKDELIDICELVSRSYELFSPCFAEKKILFSYECAKELQVWIDRDRLRQALSNLLSNALKFTEAGEVKVVVEKVVANEGAEFYQVSVCDSGPGVPDEEVDNIFKRFHQADSSETRQQGGSGLGLNICKEIIEHYRGRIWYEKNSPCGSCFRFTLPVANQYSK